MKFTDLVDRICQRSPFQKKRLSAYLTTKDAAFFEEADRFTERYGSFLESRGISIDDAVDAYLKMCSDMLRCQVDFMRTGSYPTTSGEQARAMVYENTEQMLPYMVGLGISQFLWSTHYRIYSFFGAVLGERAADTRSYLEIGPGHGLLLVRALELLNASERNVAIDISKTSLDLARAILRHSLPACDNVEFVLGDILEADLGGKFDFISMGEVLEHVEQPQVLLKALKRMLNPGGRIFISTCANCPAIDHVYQFDTVQQIRELIRSSGLNIERDLPLPVEDMSVVDAEFHKVTINYCAILE